MIYPKYYLQSSKIASSNRVISSFLIGEISITSCSNSLAVTLVKDSCLDIDTSQLFTLTYRLVLIYFYAQRSKIP